MKLRFLTLSVILAALLVSAACTPASPTAPAAATQVGPAPTQAAAPTTGAATAAAAPTTASNSEKGLVPTPPADGSRPLAKIAPEKRADAFSGPAPISVTPGTVYVATIETDKGNIVAELYPDATNGVNNFVTLAKDGFYDGLTFHRVEPGFVIQGGDPVGSGTGGPGYTIPAEINHTHTKGALAWARTSDQVNPQRASSGSQFYITLADTPQLDGAYSVFGQVTQGMDVAEKIQVGDKIKQITIAESQTSHLPTPLPPTPTREPSAPKPTEGRPLAQMPVEQREKLYTMPPAMTIDPNKKYEATVSTAKGNVVIELDAKAAPNAVNNFVVLANLGYYDGMPVSFVRPGTFTVLGSPKGQEGSDVGYTLKPEAPAGGSKVITGTVSMYPSPDQKAGQWLASGSQMLLWLTAAPQMDVPLTTFGQVTSGMDTVNKLAAGDKIDKIEITEK